MAPSSTTRIVRRVALIRLLKAPVRQHSLGTRHWQGEGSMRRRRPTVHLMCPWLMMLLLLSGCTATRDRLVAATVVPPLSESQTTPGAAAAGQTQSDSTRPGAPLLRVGITPSYPPLAFQEQGTLSGLEPDMARAIGQELGRPVVYVERPWETLIPTTSLYSALSLPPLSV